VGFLREARILLSGVQWCRQSLWPGQLCEPCFFSEVPPCDILSVPCRTLEKGQQGQQEEEQKVQEEQEGVRIRLWLWLRIRLLNVVLAGSDSAGSDSVDLDQFSP
jgi:hypothetical protein